jgi:16S rRNA (uracil1498-N3)-methyltransferase
MHRFYLPDINIAQNKIIINDKDAAHHIKNVLRLKEKDKICIFDGKGNEYTGSLEFSSSKDMLMNIEDKLASQEFAVNITVACAIPKKAKMDDIIDKLTQLGVDRIIPLETERVIIKLDKQKKISRLQRWQKIAQNAAQQSQRNTLPIIEPIKNIEEVLSQLADYDLKLIPTLSGERKTLKEVFAKTKAKNILVLIGPEGDFTLEEVNLAKQAGCILVSLGDLVLRVETAATMLVSILNYALK